MVNYPRLLYPVRMEGRKRPGWKRVKDKQAKAIILGMVSKRSGEQA